MDRFIPRKLQSSPAILSIVLIVLGLILAIWPRATLNIAVTVLAIGLLIGGVSSFLAWQRNKQSTTPVDGVIGAAAAIGGLVLLIWPSLIINIIPTVLALAILFNGLVNLFKALDLKKVGHPSWPSSLVMAVITIVAAIFVFANPAFIANNIVRVVGLVLIYNGLTSLFIATRK